MPRLEFDMLVPPGKSRERLDSYLARHLENATRSKVQQAIREGYVLVDGRTVRSSHRVSPGEKIHVTIPGTPPPTVTAEDIPLDIVYEDQHLIVLNKPAGMVTHPAYSHYSGTLVNALLHHWRSGPLPFADMTRPGIVHRLDKDTSGLMVVARDDITLARLAKQFSERTIRREYQAIIWGCPRGGRGTVDAALGRSVSDRKKIAVSGTGKAAATDFEVLETFDYLSLVRLRLRTGRTHQIRVHMHHIGHPVFGDPSYGGRRIAWGGTGARKKGEVQHMLVIMKRQALHAKTLGFIHPETKEMMQFDSDLPPDISEMLALLRQLREDGGRPPL